MAEQKHTVSHYLLGFYTLLAAIALLFGLMDSNSLFKKACDEPTRISILFPTYHLGCWLGKPIE